LPKKRKLSKGEWRVINLLRKRQSVICNCVFHPGVRVQQIYGTAHIMPAAAEPTHRGGNA
jgi:hypothetical protein